MIAHGRSWRWFRNLRDHGCAALARFNCEIAAQQLDPLANAGQAGTLVTTANLDPSAIV
jgi:hypothetical protein